MKSKKCSWVSLVGAVQRLAQWLRPVPPGAERNQGDVTERAALPPRREQTTGESWHGSNRQPQWRKIALKRCQNWCCVADGEEHGVQFRKVLTCWKEYGGGSQLLRMSKCRRELLLLLFLPHLIFACKKVSCRRWWWWFTVDVSWDSLESAMTTHLLWLSYSQQSIHTIFPQIEFHSKLTVFHIRDRLTSHQWWFVTCQKMSLFHWQSTRASWRESCCMPDSKCLNPVDH